MRLPLGAHSLVNELSFHRRRNLRPQQFWDMPLDLIRRELDICHGLLNKSPQAASWLVQRHLKLRRRVAVRIKTQTRNKSPPFQVESLEREQQDEKVRQILEDVETI